MGAKSRGGWPVGICLKDCGNRDIKCKSCRKFSNLIATLKTNAVAKPVMASIWIDESGFHLEYKDDRGE